MCNKKETKIWERLSHFGGVVTYKNRRKFSGRREEHMETVRVWAVWLDEQAKIASFHAVDGYRRQEFTNQEYFHKYMMSLQERGFRFQ